MSSSHTYRIRRSRAPRATAIIVVATMLIGCSGSPAATVTPVPTVASSAPSTASPAAPSASATPIPAPSSAAPTVAAVCLPPDVLAAIGELATGDLDPSVPRDQMADAIEAINPDEIDSSLHPYHDALVNMLRKEEVRDSLGSMAQDFLEIADGRIGAC